MSYTNTTYYHSPFCAIVNSHSHQLHALQIPPFDSGTINLQHPIPILSQDVPQSHPLCPTHSPIVHPKEYISTHLPVYGVQSPCVLHRPVLCIRLRMIKQSHPQPGLPEAASCSAHALILPVVDQPEPLLLGQSAETRSSRYRSSAKVRDTQINISSD